MSVITIGIAALIAFLAAAPAGADAARVAQATIQPRTQLDSREFPRQTMTVWFHKPVKVGDRILFGKYIVEHDNNRMARGRPCTHIYAASDPRLPVVAFHCTHLKRPLTAAPTLVVRPLGEANGLTQLLAFQFAGETAAHGVPAGR